MKRDFTIRAAVPEDAVELTEMFIEYGKSLKDMGLQYDLNPDGVPGVMAGRIRSRMFHAGVAEAGGEIIGFVFCSIARIAGEYLCNGGSQVGYLNDVYVKPARRESGIAAALVSGAEAWLLESGVTAMELQVVSGNCTGMAFWEKHGARPVGALYYKELSEMELKQK